MPSGDPLPEIVGRAAGSLVFTGILGALSLILIRSGRSSDWEVTGSVPDLRQHAQMAADSPRSTAGERYPDAAPAVAGAVLIDDLPLVLEADSSPDVHLECPSGFNCSGLLLLSFPSCPVLGSTATWGSWMRLLAGG